MAKVESQPSAEAKPREDADVALAPVAAEDANEEKRDDETAAGAAVSDVSSPVGSPTSDIDPDDLLGELARAMHAAAVSQHERISPSLERRRKEQVDAIATRARADVEDLKAGSEADMKAIDAWAKAETQKIKADRIRRIEARREELARQLERQEGAKAREVDAVEAAIDGYRAEMEAFFGRLEAESDPATIARVASMVPPYPPLAEIAEHARDGSNPESPVEASSEQVWRTEGAGAEPTVGVSTLIGLGEPSTDGGTDGGSAPTLDATTPGRAGDGDKSHGLAGFRASLLQTIPALRPMEGLRGTAFDEDDAEP